MTQCLTLDPSLNLPLASICQFVAQLRCCRGVLDRPITAGAYVYNATAQGRCCHLGGEIFAARTAPEVPRYAVYRAAAAALLDIIATESFGGECAPAQDRAKSLHRPDNEQRAVAQRAA